jgi:hypothetical protein
MFATVMAGPTWSVTLAFAQDSKFPGAAKMNPKIIYDSSQTTIVP